MEVIHPRCAGVDVSKKDAKVCVRVQGRGRRGTSMTVTTWGSTTAEILALGEHLLAQQVSCVVIESTSDYWKPFYCLLEGQLPVMLVNTKALEDAGIKLSAVASNIVGVSGRAMLEALIAGERDPVVLADLAKRGMRQKIPALTEALRGRFTEHHAFMVRLYLDRIDAHSADIARLDGRIEAAIAPFRFARELLMSIPGWSQVVADVFIAETGADMSVFPTAEHLASWAGVVPGCDESAGRVKSGSTRPGNRHLKAALGVAALSAARTKDTYYSVRYRRIAGRRRAARSRRNKTRGLSVAGQIALVAIEHKMLTDAWHMLTNGAFYRDPGPDYYTRHHPARTKTKAIKQLESPGYKVTLEPLTEAA